MNQTKERTNRVVHKAGASGDTDPNEVAFVVRQASLPTCSVHKRSMELICYHLINKGGVEYDHFEHSYQLKDDDLAYVPVEQHAHFLARLQQHGDDAADGAPTPALINDKELVSSVPSEESVKGEQDLAHEEASVEDVSDVNVANSANDSGNEGREEDKREDVDERSSEGDGRELAEESLLLSLPEGNENERKSESEDRIQVASGGGLAKEDGVQGGEEASQEAAKSALELMDDVLEQIISSTSSSSSASEISRSASSESGPKELEGAVPSATSKGPSQFLSKSEIEPLVEDDFVLIERSPTSDESDVVAAPNAAKSEKTPRRKGTPTNGGRTEALERAVSTDLTEAIDREMEKAYPVYRTLKRTFSGESDGDEGRDDLSPPVQQKVENMLNLQQLLENPAMLLETFFTYQTADGTPHSQEQFLATVVSPLLKAIPDFKIVVDFISPGQEDSMTVAVDLHYEGFHFGESLSVFSYPPIQATGQQLITPTETNVFIFSPSGLLMAWTVEKPPVSAEDGSALNEGGFQGVYSSLGGTVPLSHSLYLSPRPVSPRHVEFNEEELDAVSLAKSAPALRPALSKQKSSSSTRQKALQKSVSTIQKGKTTAKSVIVSRVERDRSIRGNRKKVERIFSSDSYLLDSTEDNGESHEMNKQKIEPLPSLPSKKSKAKKTSKEEVTVMGETLEKEKGGKRKSPKKRQRSPKKHKK